MGETTNNTTTPSPSETQRGSDAILQRSTPNEDAASQRDTAGTTEIHDPEKKRLHEEAASYRKRAKELEAQLKPYLEAEQQKRDAELSQVEKVTKQAEAERARAEQYKQQYVSAQVQLAAQKKGIIDPEMAALAVQKSLEYDENGLPSNLDKALDELVKNKPYLVKAAEASPPASPAQTAQPASTPTIPAMNPGRSSIPSPAGSPPPGGRPRIPSWSEVYSNPNNTKR